MKTWKSGEIIYSHTDSTTANGFFTPDKAILSSLTPGWYVIEFRAKNPGGEEIMDRKYIQIADNSGKTINPGYNLVGEENKTGEPGSSVKIQTGSGADDLFVIRLKRTISDSAKRYSLQTGPAYK
jgi:hypothetical protein